MIEVIITVIWAQLGWEIKQNVRALLWDNKEIILRWVVAAVGCAVPLVFKTGLFQTLNHVVLPVIRAGAMECWDIVHSLYVVTRNTILVTYDRRRRWRRIVRESSGRTQKVLELLDIDELGGDEMELIGRRQYVRCAVLISRRARQGLKFPGHSKANERIAADWILKHLPEDMTLGVRHKVLPLAVKLTFVRSHHEVRADYHFSLLADLIERA